MQVEFSLGQPIARVTVAGLASVLCLLSAYLAATNFVVNALVTPGVSLTRSEIESTSRYFPKSAEVQALVAAAELADTRDPDSAAARAESAALGAANLTPSNFEYPLLVALAREMKGDRAGAESAVREALKLAPNRVETKWRLANLLIRQGKLDEAATLFSQVLGARHVLIPQTLALVWTVSKGDIQKMEAAVGESPKARRDLAFFLMQRGFVPEGVRVFSSISRADRLASDESGAFITGVRDLGQLELARRIWGDLVTERKEDLKPLLYNGSFETQPNPSFDHFDWFLGETRYARVSLDSSTSHAGSGSLRIDFAGIDTTRIDGEIKQQLLVRPGGRYRLSCYVKTSGLVTSEGPRLVVATVNNATQIAASYAIAAGSSDWRQLAVEFTAPASLGTLTVHVKRIPKFSYDEPTRGTIWFDDLELTEIGGGN